MENIKLESKTINKRKKPTARVRLSEDVQFKLVDWQNQIQQKFNGMLKVNSSELVNIILKESSDKLTSAALNSIKERKLTDVQKVKWMLQRLEESKKGGVSVSLKELIKETQRSQIKANTKSKKTLPKQPESTKNRGV